MKSQDPYKHTPALENSRSYMGSVMTIPVIGKTTGGRFAMVEYRAKPGNEPPPHYHQWEHEYYYLVDGDLRVYCGEKTLSVTKGDYVFVPQGEAHAFDILSATVQMIIMVTSVNEHEVGLDRYFIEMSEPATSISLPADATTYALSDTGRAIRLAAQNGTIILSPEETARALPNYPGFGSLRREVEVQSAR